MTIAHLQLLTPTTQKRTVMPRRIPNHELRPREHLTEREVEKLMAAAKKNRHGQRDAAMILICFRHGLRASELCELQWSDVEFETATLHLRRAKNGAMGTHPLIGDELRTLRALKREAKSLCVPKTLSVLIGGGNHLTSAHNDRAAMLCP
jgi:integrase